MKNQRHPGSAQRKRSDTLPRVGAIEFVKMTAEAVRLTVQAELERKREIEAEPKTVKRYQVHYAGYPQLSVPDCGSDDNAKELVRDLVARVDTLGVIGYKALLGFDGAKLVLYAQRP
jgi:hypothetical protein